MKRVLVLGIKGMVGHVLFRKLSMSPDYKVFGVARDVEETPEIYNVDVFNTDKINEIIDKEQFDIIINCIGILNKTAEDNPNDAVWLNSFFPHFLAAAVKNTSTKIIQMSTDCVFSGKKGNYVENDFKDGVGFYAQSKALGEVLYDRHLTIRTSIIGPELKLNGIGLFNWFMRQKGDIRGYKEAIWTGITTFELAKVIEKLIENDVSGLQHLVSGQKISKYDLISCFKETFNKDDINIEPYYDFKTDKSLVKSANTFNYDIPSYEKMIVEMKEWILNNRDIYSHYTV